MDPKDTIEDPLSGTEYDCAEIEGREFGQEFLDRDAELRDYTLSQYDDMRCEQRYGDDSDSYSDEY